VLQVCQSLTHPHGIVVCTLDCCLHIRGAVCIHHSSRGALEPSGGHPAGRQTDRQMHRRVGEQTKRQIDRGTDGQAGKTYTAKQAEQQGVWRSLVMIRCDSRFGLCKCR
jgi:hypothetical protein